MAKKRTKSNPTRRLFNDPTGQKNMFEKSYQEELEENAQVECLGMTFTNDAERRQYFLDKLRQKLQDPEFRKIEGFPIGEDEDILALSDPPYYTACPNPFIEDFIRCYGKPYDPANDDYHREPFAADVSEGKNDPIYNAHSYHTKVPHKAIMRYILHYTEPGDVVFDGFCGTGMAGVAARLCGSNQAVVSMGYRVSTNGTILDSSNSRISQVGGRRAILSDLSPIATFIAGNYADLSSLPAFTEEALKLVSKAEKELGWLYEGVAGGKVLNAVWSDLFLCPTCSHEFVFWEAVLKDGVMQGSFPCPHCGTIVGKAASKTTGAIKLERPFTAAFDPILKKVVRVPKLALVQETTKTGSTRKTRLIKDKERKSLVSRFEGRSWPHVPEDEFFPGRQTNKLINGSGISHVCHMYTQRALFAYGYLWQQSLSSHKRTSLFRFCLSGINNYISRKQGYFGGGGGVSGTLFTPSLHLERNVFDVLRRKLRKLQSLAVVEDEQGCVSTQSIADLRNVPSGTVDYVFTDPPFGESLQYAELNMFMEAWLKVRTVSENDCVLNYVHKKDLPFYSHMMLGAFKEYARVLKPGRWITIEFHNSQNAVWSAIQQAIESSGLVVADVRVLDKQQRSFNAVNRSGAVDQDLVISAYKPNSGLEDRFKLEAGSDDGAWDFLRTHLRQLPVFASKEGQAEVIAERQSFLLFDRMVAFHVQRGVTVPLSAAEFYQGLARGLAERDGMYFLPDQVAEYDKKRMKVERVEQLELFVIDEKSAIQWLRSELGRKPQTYQDIMPAFLQQLHKADHEQLPELSSLLDENFLMYDGAGDVPSQIHAYLSTNYHDLRSLPSDSLMLKEKAKNRWYVPDPNKMADLEQLRQRHLIKEFETYRETKGKLKTFRSEAVRVGFRACWNSGDYKTIVEIGNRLPTNVLQEDEALLMYYDNASTLLGK